ncbi:SDR family oxidoreductase [Mycobacterium parmense]|uniref:Short-chain dehydrogenase n=1 Tax=Mycobacterium parmense TaxID=185642 RepID=A0A7I7YXB9_9MYCO|nr:SDR family oxidoreductase [Mycobacterium parmense]MCV7350011.1 SDR family oxidoreductase [Mycobacterium parmense]ORW59292.1 short-chain dehydrogenase [Mycobacterium parmense]BBZ46456.1 short-chain dehydrogenase [Mycobacterium parmense]
MSQTLPITDGLVGTTAIVTGASRGFGRAIATALWGAGAEVVGVARTRSLLEGVRDDLGDRFVPVVADVADAVAAERLIDEYRPRTLVLCAGAAPRMSPLREQTWETFSENWNVDVAQTFHWTRAALRRPLAPGSTVIAMSSGAALAGSPLSGGYAGAKAAVKFVTSYAATEAQRAGLGIRFVSVLPRLTPATDLGAEAVAAYAERQGVDVEEFVRASGPALSAQEVGRSVREIAGGDPDGNESYLLTASGLTPLG